MRTSITVGMTPWACMPRNSCTDTRGIFSERTVRWRCHHLRRMNTPPVSQPTAAHSCEPNSATLGAAPSQSVAAINSAALLQGGKSITISHNGELYRLQTTRQGKLILTK